MRRGVRALSTVMMVTGALLVTDAVLTVAWQEPVTALLTKIRQGEVADDVEALERRAPSRAERDVLADLREARARIAFRARSLRRRMRDGGGIGRIRFRGASHVVVEGTGGSALRKGPGHYPRTPLPGLPGTVGIAGHRTTYGAPFRDLDRLDAGDEIEVEMPYATFTYRVERTRIVAPTATWVVRRVRFDRLVLTACHPRYSAAKRIVVFARQVAAVERTPA